MGETDGGEELLGLPSARNPEELLGLPSAEYPEELLGLSSGEYPEETEDPRMMEPYDWTGVGSSSGKSDISMVELVGVESERCSGIPADPVAGSLITASALGWDLVD